MWLPSPLRFRFIFEFHLAPVTLVAVLKNQYNYSKILYCNDSSGVDARIRSPGKFPALILGGRLYLRCKTIFLKK